MAIILAVAHQTDLSQIIRTRILCVRVITINRIESHSNQHYFYGCKSCQGTSQKMHSVPNQTQSIFREVVGNTLIPSIPGRLLTSCMAVQTVRHTSQSMELNTGQSSQQSNKNPSCIVQIRIDMQPCKPGPQTFFKYFYCHSDDPERLRHLAYKKPKGDRRLKARELPGTRR